MRSPLPKRVSLTPLHISHATHKNTGKINLARIYESDLFGTYTPTSPTESTTPLRQHVSIPQPPHQQPVEKIHPQPPEFLSPLQVILKGAIFNSNSAYSRAILSDATTKEEKLYKIGDKIEDAHLIYIGKNKAIFLRSNGQQETLFVSEEDAQNDPIHKQEKWSSVIESQDNNTFIIYANAFKKNITGLAPVLDMLDITTAFEKGKSIGLRIGRIEQGALGSMLGLQYGDIVTHINDTSTTSTKERVTIYQNILQGGNNQRIKVQLVRNNTPHTLTYFVQKKIENDHTSNTVPTDSYVQVHNNRPATPQSQLDTKLAEHTLAQSSQDANFARNLTKQDRQAMLQYGGKNNVLQR